MTRLDARGSPSIVRPSRRAALGGLAAAALLGASCRRRAPSGGVPRRIVSISPNTTEALFAVGAGALVVGRSRYCDHPPEVLRIPQVGGYVDPSLEKILSLTPDLVTGARGPIGTVLTDKLGAHGIATFFPPTESLAEIDAMIGELASRVGRPAEGAEVVRASQARRAEVTARVSGRPRPRVLLLFGLAPVSVAGPGSFADEMLTLAGAENAIARVAKEGGRPVSPYPTIDVEQVIALDPDLILDAAMQENASTERIASALHAVRAVRERHVVRIASETVLRPGPRVAEGIVELARAVHPDVGL